MLNKSLHAYTMVTISLYVYTMVTLSLYTYTMVTVLPYTYIQHGDHFHIIASLLYIAKEPAISAKPFALQNYKVVTVCIMISLLSPA